MNVLGFAPRLLLAAALVLPAAGHAESEVYAGIGIGYGILEVEIPGDKFEGSDVVTRQNLGLRFNDYLAVEAGFLRMGTPSDEVRLSPAAPSLSRDIRTYGYNAYLVGSYPLDQELLAFVKVGLIRWDAEISNEQSAFDQKLDGDDTALGLGLDFRGYGRLRVRVEAEFLDMEFADSYWALSTSVMYAIPIGR